MSKIKPYTYSTEDLGSSLFLNSGNQGPFDEWNVPSTRLFRNCYAFACNAFEPDLDTIPSLMKSVQSGSSTKVTVLIPTPGTTGGETLKACTPKALRRALIVDGFLPQPQKDYREIRIPKGHDLIAAYCHTEDFHFYRFHIPSNVWFHKNGWFRSVSGCDAQGSSIIDPQKAHRGDYDQFAGFYLSPPCRPPMNIVVKNGQDKIIYGSIVRPRPSFKIDS